VQPTIRIRASSSSVASVPLAVVLLVATVLVAFVLWPASAASAETLTLGPELSRYADSDTAGCSTNPFSGSPLSAPSCTWASVSVGSANPLVVLGTGTISQVSVKVGASTGMMKAVLVQASAQIFGEGEAEHVQVSCCTDVAESPPFTPAPNSITTVPVDLSATNEFDPQSGTLYLDYVALSVLEAGVPIPAATGVQETVEGEEGEPPAELEPSDLVEAPALVPGQPAQEPQKGEGDLLLMDAVFNRTETRHFVVGPPTGPGEEPQTAPPGGATTPTTQAKAPALSLPATGGSHLRIRGADALLRLECAKQGACQGTVRLQSAEQLSTGAGALLAGARSSGARSSEAKSSGTQKASAKARLRTYAVGRFSISPGETETVTLKLSASGRRLAREHRRLRVWVNATSTTSGSGTQLFSDPLTVRF
jgi:hypothetical protein